MPSNRIPTVRRVVGYARLSKSSEESTSIARQVEAITHLAASREWELVAIYKDDGVSATHTALDRPPLLAARQTIDSGAADALVVFKLDRLCRSVSDFSKVIGDREGEWGLNVTSVTEPIDTTTPAGRAMAQVTQVFAELEAATIAERVRSSVAYLRQNGRRAGGQVPYGWTNVPNPDGDGMVARPDPERIGYVREAADRVMAGESVLAVAHDFTDRKVPVPQPRRNGRDAWNPDSLLLLLRNPILAGMTVHHGDVIYTSDGLPRVDEAVAILTVAERDQLLRTLAARSMAKPRRGNGPALLAGFAYCDACGRRLHASRPEGKPESWRYSCSDRACARAKTAAQVSMASLDQAVEDWLLEGGRGRLPLYRRVEESGPDHHAVTAVESALKDTSEALAEATDEGTEDELLARLRQLKARLRELKTETGEPTVTYEPLGTTLAEAWHACLSVEARRELVAQFVDEVVVKRSTRKVGRAGGLDPDRVVIHGHEELPVWDLD